MPSSLARLPLAASLALLLSSPVLADRPEWPPVAELLVGGIGHADPVRMADVMSRCTALNLLFAGLSADVAPEMALTYRNEAHFMMEQGVLLESNMADLEDKAAGREESTGAEREAEITRLSGEVIEKVKVMVQGYTDWIDDNKVRDGYFIDKAIEQEMASCNLASRFAHRI